MNALLAQRYEARIGTGGLFWGLLWRTGFSGLVFGAMLIAIFGAALPAPSGMGHLGLRGALFGTVAGAIENSVLGALCGLVFFATTGAFYLPVPADVRDYLTTAGAMCALAGSGDRRPWGGDARRPPRHLQAAAGARAVFQGRLPAARGSATTIFRPENSPGDSFALVSGGRRFGEAGHYWVHRIDGAALRVKRLPMEETIHVFVDSEVALNSQHAFAFWRTRFLTLHYDISCRSQGCSHSDPILSADNGSVTMRTKRSTTFPQDAQSIDPTSAQNGYRS